MSNVFDLGSTNVALALDVPFPANVISGAGVSVNKSGGTWTVGLDYVDLNQNTSPTPGSNFFVAVYDVAGNAYEKVRIDTLVGAAAGVDQRTAIGDANYLCTTNDRYVGLAAALTAIRTITLPAANSVPPGRSLTIQDEFGGITQTNYHSIVPQGSDTIDGRTSWIQKTTYGAVAFRSDGTGKWSFALPEGRSVVADANYTATQGDSVISYTSITAARTVTLPAANTYPRGKRLTIIDSSGACSGTLTITVAAAGTDLINGVANTVIGIAYGYRSLLSDGTSRWTIADASSVAGMSGGTILGNVTIGSGNLVVNPNGIACQGAAASLTTYDQGGSGGNTANFVQLVRNANVGTLQLTEAVVMSMATTGTATFAHAVTVSAGGLTVTAGGLTVSAGGAAITGHTVISGDNGNWDASATFVCSPTAGIGLRGGSFWCTGTSQQALFVRADTVNGFLVNFGFGAGAQCGAITVTGTGTTCNYATSCDGRLKDNVRSLASEINVGDIIDRLEPVMFEWNHVPERPTGRGFVAQALYEVVPEAVTPGLDRYDPELQIGAWTADFSKLIPYMIAEIKSLRARVAKLEGGA